MSFAFQQNNKMALLRTKGQPKKTPIAMELRIVALKARSTSQRGSLATDKCRKDCAGVGEAHGRRSRSNWKGRRRTNSLAQAINVKFFLAAAA